VVPPLERLIPREFQKTILYEKKRLEPVLLTVFSYTCHLLSRPNVCGILLKKRLKEEFLLFHKRPNVMQWALHFQDIGGLGHIQSWSYLKSVPTFRKYRQITHIDEFGNDVNCIVNLDGGPVTCFVDLESIGKHYHADTSHFKDEDFFKFGTNQMYGLEAWKPCTKSYQLKEAKPMQCTSGLVSKAKSYKKDFSLPFLMNKGIRTLFMRHFSRFFRENRPHWGPAGEHLKIWCFEHQTKERKNSCC